MLFFSSIHVYGANQSHPIDESQHCRPNHDYGKIKLECENILLKRPNTIVVRPSQLFGYPPPPKSLLHDWLGHMRASGNAEIPTGNLNLIRDFLSIEDAVTAVKILLSQDMERLKHKIYNLSSGVGVSLKELASALNILERCKSSSKFLRETDVPILISNNARMLSLDWRPTVQINEWLKTLVI